MVFYTNLKSMFVEIPFIFLLLISFSICPQRALSNRFDPSPLSTNFLFGTASSAYQVINFIFNINNIYVFMFCDLLIDNQPIIYLQYGFLN